MKKSEKIVLSICIIFLLFNVTNILICNFYYGDGKQDVHVVLLEKTTTPHVVTHKQTSTITGTDRWFMVTSKEYGFGEFKVGLNDYMRYKKGDGIIYEVTKNDINNYFGAKLENRYCESGAQVSVIFLVSALTILILLLVSAIKGWVY